MPEQGDWYARNIYEEGQPAYNYHIKTFGHPSEFGYKDICNLWRVDKWDPDALAKLYVEMGAKYSLWPWGTIMMPISITGIQNISHGTR